jgi:hypothetical protein
MTDREELIPVLRDLLHSDGWTWFTDYVAKEWGPAAYGRKINAALSTIPAGPDYPYEVAKVTQQIHAECEAINALVKHPSELLKRLTDKTPARRFDRFRRTLESA